MCTVTQTIQEIRTKLNAADQTVNARMKKLATDYTELCRDLNDKLNQCAEIIRKGELDKAILFAEKKPALLEVVRQVNFKGRNEWQTLCQLYSLSEAPELDKTALEILKKSYKDEQAMKPFLVAYRKVVHRGSLVEKIELLRKLVNVPHDNRKTVLKDLAGCEKKRLRELTEQARTAIDGAKELELQDIYLELTECDWKARVDDKVLEKVLRELNRLKSASLRLRCDVLVKQVNTAYSLLDIQGTDVALKQWNLLEKEALFTANEEDNRQISDATNWLNGEKKHLELTQNFANAQTKLSLSLDDKKEFELIEKIYFELQNFGLAIDTALLQRYNETKDNYEMDKSRRFRAKLISIVLIFVLIAGTAFYIVDAHQKQKVYDKWHDDVAQAIEQQDYKTAQTILSNLKSDNAKLFKRPEFQQFNSDVMLALTTIKAKRNTFNQVTKQLAEMAKKKYRPYKSTVELLKKGETVRQSAKEQQILATHCSALEKAKATYQNNIDKTFTAKMEEIVALGDGIYPEEASDLSQVTHQIQDLNAKGNNLLGTHKQMVTANVWKAQETKLMTKVTDLKSRLSATDTKRLKLVTDIQKVRSTYLPLESYHKNLNQFLETHPDVPEAKRFEEIVKCLPLYRVAESLKTGHIQNLSGVVYKNILKKMKTLNAPELWQSDFERIAKVIIATEDGREEAEKQLTNISKQGYLEHRELCFKDESGQLHYYYFSKKDKIGKKLLFKSENDGDAVTFRSLSGKKVKLFKANTPNELIVNTLNSELRNCTLISDPIKWSPMQRDFISSIRKSKFPKGAAMTGYIINRLVAIQKDSMINPYIKVECTIFLLRALKPITTSILTSKASKLEADIKEQFSNVVANMADKDIRYGSMSPDTQDLLQKIVNKFPDFSTLKEEMPKLDLLKLAGMNRQVTAVGVVGTDKRITIADNSFEGELWLLQVARKGQPHFVVIGHGAAGVATVEKAWQGLLKAGEIIFAPGDKKSTKELAKKFKESAKSSPVNWPSYWPQNRRD